MLITAFVVPAGAANESVKQIVYDFMTGELGLCPAAAAGIMGNVQIECSFDPTIEAMDTNGLYSFGLMMWNGSRYTALKDYCTKNKLDKNDPLAQLKFLKYELETSQSSVYETMKNIPNTIEGAAEAAIQWADQFEKCTKTAYGLRVYYALNEFWPQYAGGTFSKTKGIFGYYYNVPDNIQYGKALTLYGVVVSYSSDLQSVTAGVYKEDGTLITGRTINIEQPAGNIGVIDRYVVFNSIPKGTYYYTITAVNAAGQYQVEKHEFTVSDKETTYSLVPSSSGGAMCDLGAKCPQLGFTDMVSANNWAHSYIDHALNKGYMNGISPVIFNPSGLITRAMMVTILRRYTEINGIQITLPETEDSTAETTAGTEGTEETSVKGYDDVLQTSWYYDNVMWATEYGIVNGKSDTIFDPNSSATREEIVTILFRYAKICNAVVDENMDPTLIESFPDVSKVNVWAYDAFAWATTVGIIQGNTDGKGNSVIDPQSNTTRAQTAALFKRLEGVIY